MSINSLKKVLIEKIVASEDETVLHVIYKLLDNLHEPYVLTEADKNAVKEAKSEYASGNVLSDEDLQNELDKWLK